jgi:hypothetical protein
MRRRIARAWSEQEAREVLAKWAASGETMWGFARARGLTPQRVAWWRKKLGGGGAERTPACGVAETFVPVMVRAREVSRVGVEAAPSPVVVGVGEAVRVEVRELSAQSAAWVARLASELSEVGA